jgi:type I restriction enzyme S subunit
MLGDHVDFLTGFPFKSALFVKSPDAIRLLKGSVVSPGTLDWSDAVGWPTSDIAAYTKFELQVGDVVLAMDRPWIEAGLKYAWITVHDVPSLLVQRVARLRGRNGLDTAFLRYVIGSPEFTNYIAPIVTGVNVPHISPRQICSFHFHLPPLPIQRKIAAVLSTYDDLIENNNRRIELLEEMAQRIYREWFVEFRHPGHENVQLVDSELGPIPEGWNVVPVGEITPILGGGTPSKTVAKYWEGGTVNWFTPTDLTAADAMFVSTSRRKITEQGLAQSSAKIFPAGSVMMTSRATIGVVAITTVPAATNQGFITCPSTPQVGTFHLYFWLLQQREVIISLASGATFKEINKATFRQIPFLRADARVEREFEGLVEPIGHEIENLLQAQRNLRATRDLLLPRLISGEIDVTDLDIVVPKAAA